MQRLIFFIGILFLFTLASCDKESNPTVNYDRRPLLENFADNLIVPGYENLLTETELLKTAIENFNTTSNQENLASLRAQWLKAYRTYQRIGFFNFGPAEEVFLNVSLNSFPTSKLKIENNITSGGYDLSSVTNPDAKGFPALDYLLFGIGSDEETLAFYTSDGNAANRKTYLSAIATDMVTRVSAVKMAWDASGSNYRETFLSRTGNDASSSLKFLVEGIVQYLERDVRDLKVGIPLGIRSLNVPIPNNAEALYAQESVALAAESVAALQNIYHGKSTADGEGFDDYLTALNARYNGASLNDAIKDQLALTLQKVSEMPEPFSEAVENNQAPIAAAYQELQKLTLLMKNDLPSAIGVTITYQDNDGD